MKTEIQKALSLNKFFSLRSFANGSMSYNLTKSSLIFLHNIYISWLQSVNTKTIRYMPVFTTEKISSNKSLPFGFIANHVIKYDESTILEHDFHNCTWKNTSQIQLNLIVPRHTSMQYFIQWQRYRKYWWSSVTTSPSLFAINEVKYEEEKADSNIVAQFPWGQQTVETISMISKGKGQNCSHLKCSMILESAMFILLLDGLMNKRESEYLKLHRSMAPYKISFAINIEDSINTSNLNKLAYLMHKRLITRDISACLPDFTLSLEEQIKENLQLGITYTAILYDKTATNGIFHLLNSSTMLKEEVHVADFDSYATMLCGK